MVSLLYFRTFRSGCIPLSLELSGHHSITANNLLTHCKFIFYSYQYYGMSLSYNTTLSVWHERNGLQTILPCLGYYAAIWDPFHHNLLYQLEMIQHRAARFALNRPWIRGHHDSITEMLCTLEWTTLETQRSHSHLLMLIKILNHHISIPDQYLPVRNPSQLLNVII